jgi:hypothetical protein
MISGRIPGAIMSNPIEWERPAEPFGRVLRRTVGIALGVGAGVALFAQQPRMFLPMSLVALWPALGGHYVEIVFLTGVRPLLPSGRAMQVGARILVWLAAGVGLYVLMALTAQTLPLRPFPWRWCWVGGPAFVVIELLAHVALALRRLPNFYDGRA